MRPHAKTIKTTMKPIIFNPAFVMDIVNESKPAMLTISKTNLVFNSKATKLLALKKGDNLSLHLVDDKLQVKIPSTDGFKISCINGKGCACIPVPGILIALKRHIKVPTKNIRYEIGEFKDGIWPLIPTDGELASLR